MNKFLAAGLALFAFIVLAWVTASSLLHLQGGQFWILFSALTVLGAMGTTAYLWFSSLQRKPEAAEAEAASSPKNEMALLIREAESTLKHSGKAEGKLGSLPLFFVLGESGAAKTSTIIHSGLEPELLAGQVFQDTDIVPTRLANIWISRGVVYAEPGGKLLGDVTQWRNLILRLQPARMRSVLGRGANAPRAAVVCVDSEMFLQQGAHSTIEKLARSLGARLSDISQTLGASFPVYVLFTRMDRLPFFLEFVRNLSETEASEVLGATLPGQKNGAGAYAEQQTQRVQTAFDDLFHSLAARRPEFLQREHEFAQLPAVYEFPREFYKLRSLLTRFLVDLCKPSELRESPFLRGFYFCGVRPVIQSDIAPAPARRASAAPAAGRSPDATSIFVMPHGPGEPLTEGFAPTSLGTRKVPQWVFLKQLFADILPADHSAMRQSTSSSKTAFLQRILLASAAVLSLLWLVAMLFSYSANRRLESTVLEASGNLPRASYMGTTTPSVDELTRMDRLRRVLADFDQYRTLRFHWGLYRSDDVYPKAREIYFQRLFRPLLFQSTQSNLIGDFSSRAGQFDPVYNALKAYLMTTSNPEKSITERQWLSQQLLSAWGRGRDYKDRERLVKNQFDFYTEQLGRGSPYAPATDPGVLSARDYLYSFQQYDRVYRLKLDEAAKASGPIDFSLMYPQNSVVDRHIVPAAYTKPGWAAMQAAIKKSSIAPDWVLGPAPPGSKDTAGLEQQLQDRYRKDYIEEWRKFLRNAAVADYTNLTDAAVKLEKTAGGNQSPLLGLLGLVSEHTSVDPEVSQAFAAATVVVPPGKKGEYFGPSNKPYMDSLIALQMSVDQAAKNPDPANPALPALADSQMKARGAALQLAASMPEDREARLNGTVKKLLEDPITKLRVPGPGEALKAKGAALCNQFAVLKRKYPFNVNASATPATLDEVNAFFNMSTGSLWGFYNEHLKTLLVWNGSTYAAPESGSITVTPQFTQFFNSVAGFSRAAYPNGAPQPHLAFTLANRGFEGLEDLTISVDGQAMSANTPSRQFVWPAQDVILKSSRVSQEYHGTWALFEFFGDANQWTRSGPLWDVDWKLRNQTQFGVRSTSQAGLIGTLRLGGAPSYFKPGYFAGMTCPAIVGK